MRRAVLLLLLAALLVTFASACKEKGPPNEVHSPEDVVGRVIGVLSGSPSARLAEEYGVARPYSAGADVMYALITGTVDCAIIEHSLAEELAETTDGVKVLPDPLLEYELRFAVAKENAELLRAVNSALKALEGNGTLNGLRDRYFNGKEYIYVPPTDVAPHPGFLELAVSPDDRPFSFGDGNGNFAGFSVDTALAVCDHLGVELRISAYETGELITAVWYGKADFAVGWLPGDVLDRVNLSEPYANSSHSIVVRK